MAKEKETGKAFTGKKPPAKAAEGSLFIIITVALAFIISAACVLTGGYVNKGFDLKAGGVAPRRIQSPQDVINEMATKALQDEAADRARQTPIYKLDASITQSVMYKLEVFFAGIDGMRSLYNPIINPMEERPEPVAIADLDRSLLNIDISSTSHLTFLVTCSDEIYAAFKERIAIITESRLTSGIKEDALYSISLSVKDELMTVDEWDSVVKNVGYSIISQVLKPNLLLDTESMEKAAQEAISTVEPVVVRKGQNIVVEGAPITPEIYSILESLGLVRTSLYDRIQPVAGAILLVAAALAAGVMFLRADCGHELKDKKNLALVFTLYIAAVLIARALSDMNFVFVPIILFTMLASILLNQRLAACLNLCMTVVTSMICMGDMKFILYFVLLGLFVSVVSRIITERSKMLSATVMISLFSAAAVCAVYLAADGAISKEMWDTAVIAALYGMFSVVVCVGALPFFEAVFGFVTPIKLIDLANPNSPLLRRLIIEAPGTYQHSLIVANMAETACYSIGANHALARIGGYYHDVGKLNYPQYFIENLNTGENPHNTMDPRLSAKIILEHVSNGLELANQYKLPKIIRAFIEEHHGASLQKYFYYKAKEDDPDIDESKFRYNYAIPQSRESAVVMLADSIEAAVRSMQGKPMDELEAYARALIKTALEEGRLKDSGLTIKDLDTIIDAFMRVFQGMYHKRIVYPAEAIKPSPPAKD